MSNARKDSIMGDRRARILFWILAVAALYVGFSSIAFALRHPELTDTQRLLRTFDALLWR